MPLQQIISDTETFTTILDISHDDTALSESREHTFVDPRLIFADVGINDALDTSTQFLPRGTEELMIAGDVTRLLSASLESNDLDSDFFNSHSEDRQNTARHTIPGNDSLRLTQSVIVNSSVNDQTISIRVGEPIESSAHSSEIFLTRATDSDEEIDDEPFGSLIKETDLLSSTSSSLFDIDFNEAHVEPIIYPQSHAQKRTRSSSASSIAPHSAHFSSSSDTATDDDQSDNEFANLSQTRKKKPR